MSSKLTNLLFQALPERLQARLSSEGTVVDLPLRTPIFNAEASPRYVHLLLSGVASVVTSMEGGEVVEIGIIGCEGLPEKIHLLGPQRGVSRCFMQIPGSALRIDFRRFQTLFFDDPDLQAVVHQYVQHDSLVLAQLSACNRIHEVEARLARWLLMVHDRVQTREIRLTQEFLGEMLGARRSSVNLAMMSLQRAGTLSSSRGRLYIDNLIGLESAACECTSIIRRLYGSLYGRQDDQSSQELVNGFRSGLRIG